MDPEDFWSELQDREMFREFYFLSIALILAFGTLQTTGTVLDTDRAVVSVVSCSMYPGPGEEGLYKGDILVVKGTPFDQIKEGDTIVYDVPDSINFSVAAQEYRLRKNSSSDRPSAETPVGRIELVEAVRGKDNVDRALLNVDGREVVVQEGESFQSGSMTVDVGSVHTMPIPVVHRVIRKYSDHLETKGINNPGQLDFEKDVRPDQIHGKVFFRIPRIGLIKILAMDLVGFNGDAPLVLDRYRQCRVKA